MRTGFIAILALISITITARAEWRTESYPLKPGWNAIYPSVDASHAQLDQLLAGHPQIVEIWRWQPERVDTRLPDTSVPPIGADWAVWKRGLPEETTFTHLTANYGYLVRVADAVPQFTLEIKGRAAMPEVRWRSDALHLAGFPVITSGTKPTFSSYLSATGFALGSAPILRYNGGPIVQNINPLAVVPTVNRIERGQAYWIRVNQFSRYYGPLKVELDSGSGVDFGTRSDEVKLLITNQTSGSLTFTLEPAVSESAPSGQTAVLGAVPLKVRVDAETQYTALTSRTLTLAAGTIMPVRFTVDRATMSGPQGSRFASLLRLTTTSGIAGQEVFVPVTAEVGSVAGLWIGEAQITHVGSIVRRFERDAAGKTVYDASGQPRMIEDLTTPLSGGTLPAVKRPYTLRLIVHVNASGQARLLSHIMQGKLATAPPQAPIGLVTVESLLDSTALRDAVRLSVSHLPLDTDLALGGGFVPGGTLTTPGQLTTGFTRGDNPFVHIYHPDHDNLDARFTTALAAGKESFNISRTITFGMDAVAPTDAPTSWGTSTLSGTYSEVIAGPYKSPIRVSGVFALHKVSEIPAITRP
jgi:hypothetical protein